MGRKYVAISELCHQIPVLRHPCHEFYMLLQSSFDPWEGVTMDLVSDLLESTTSVYTRILQVVDELSKMAIYLPSWKVIDSPELAQMFFEQGICTDGVWDNIVTDRGIVFTSRFWDQVCCNLIINHWLFTAFYSQTDCQTERQNQMTEDYLWVFCNEEQNNWAELLPLADFRYLNSFHHSMWMTPVWTNYHYNPMMEFKPPKEPSCRWQIKRKTWDEGWEKTHQLLRRNLEKAQAWQSKYTGWLDVTFIAGEILWLSNGHFQTNLPWM